MKVAKRKISCAVAVLSGCFLLFSGCGRSENERTAYDPKLLPVPCADAMIAVPAWNGLADADAVATRVRAMEGSTTAKMLAPGALALPCRFSVLRADRACWDIALSADLSSTEGLAFDFWCGDITQFTGFTLYLKSGADWLSAAFAPSREREWHRVTLRKATFRAVGRPADWAAVSTLRICGWRGGTNDTTLGFANLSCAVPVSEPTADERLAEQKADAAYVTGLPGRSGEWRGFWCHAWYGLPGKSWRETAHLLKMNGFTAVLPNLAWAGTAFYPSSVLPVASVVAKKGDALTACLSACRAEGLECHVWNVCWNLGHHAPPDVVRRFAATGRTQMTFDGAAKTGWLCPSDPDNLAYEIRSFVELAQRGADGVHFDYIRYPDESTCFCAGCRRRFEVCYGLALTNWPAQVRYDPVVRLLWREFRITNITALVRGVSSHVRRVAPNVKISAAVFQSPVRDSDTIGQDWVDWCRKEYLDFVCPMNYNYGSAVAFKGATYVQKRALEGTGVCLRPGIGLSAWKDDRRHDARRTAEEIVVVREAGLDGFCIFNLDARAASVLSLLREGPFRDSLEF